MLADRPPIEWSLAPQHADTCDAMNPLSYAALLVSPAIQGVSRIAAGGAGFLQALGSPQAKTDTAAQAPISFSADPKIADLQRLVAEELRRAGYAEALPLEIQDDGFGDIRVLSDSPDRGQMERLLNDHPLIAHGFEQLRSSVEFTSTLCMTIPGQAAFELSA